MSSLTPSVLIVRVIRKFFSQPFSIFYSADYVPQLWEMSNWSYLNVKFPTVLHTQSSVYVFLVENWYRIIILRGIAASHYAPVVLIVFEIFCSFWVCALHETFCLFYSTNINVPQLLRAAIVAPFNMLAFWHDTHTFSRFRFGIRTCHTYTLHTQCNNLGV
jgi:hypothetical protein